VAVRMACLKIFCEWWKKNTFLMQT
jgi:hypothetical protein